MDVLLLFSVEGSLVLTSNVVFAEIYVHLPNNEGSCSFRPSLNIHQPELHRSMTFEYSRLSYFPMTKLVKNMATLVNSKINILSLGW